MKPPGPPQSPQIVNKPAHFNYEILDKLEAGIALTGSEVKSLRGGRASLSDAYAVIRDGEVYLRNFNIQQYAQAGYSQHEPLRERKLLLHRREIKKWLSKVTQRGLTMVPLQVYFNDRGIAKLSLALCRGKQTSDKRAAIKERDVARDMARELRRRR